MDKDIYLLIDTYYKLLSGLKITSKLKDETDTSINNILNDVFQFIILDKSMKYYTMYDAKSFSKFNAFLIEHNISRHIYDIKDSTYIIVVQCSIKELRRLLNESQD